MKSLYITSVERYSGKTAVCLAIGKRLQSDGFKVGYLKPLSLNPWRIGEHTADEDAAFIKDALGLAQEPWELSPVVVTPDFLRAHLRGEGETHPLEKVKAALESAGTGQDLVLLEGGGSMREGYAIGLPTPRVAKELNSTVLAVIKYRDEIRLLDDAEATQYRVGESLCGIFINRVPAEAMPFVRGEAIPYLEGEGIPVFGALPEVRELAALTVQEIKDALQAELLTRDTPLTAMVENLTIGAMTAEAALKRFRRQRNKAVITGGDRTDIQLAALETSTSCLLLTGNLRPSPLIIKQADDLHVPVLLARDNTLETVEAIERIFGKTNLGQTTKLQQFQDLVEANINIPRLYQLIGVA